jgi:hypothetical protein
MFAFTLGVFIPSLSFFFFLVYWGLNSGPCTC